MFVSTLTNINTELLYKYIMHWIYGYEFTVAPLVNVKESLFVPSGYDSLSLIEELCKHVDSSMPFEEVIKKP